VEVLVGTCGFPKSRRQIYSTLDVVELQETFYNMPNRERMQTLREEAPDFHFTVKVFQGLTHPADSPTYKRTRGFKPTERHGLLKPTEENFQLWNEFVDSVAPLRPYVLVFQTPPSLKPESYIYDFFASVAGAGFKVAWEPRGETYKDPALIEKVASLGVVIVVDPLKRAPLVGEIYYFRLHGLPGEVNYRYKYTDGDLRKLAEIVKSLEGEAAYVLFNNVYMFDDARRFKSTIRGGMHVK